MVVWLQFPGYLLRPIDCCGVVVISHILEPHPRRRSLPFRQKRARIGLGFREYRAGVRWWLPGRDGGPLAGFTQDGVAVGFGGRVADGAADVGREVLEAAGVSYREGNVVGGG